MTNRDRIVRYLQTIAPKSATNAEIASFTGVRPHAQVFQITHELMVRGVAKGRLFGKEWAFSMPDSLSAPDEPLLPAKPQGDPAPSAPSLPTPAEFEELARQVMSRHFNIALGAGKLPGIPKTFDMVSSDRRIVGDAKQYSLVNGANLPPAKFSVIAEYVWLLEKADADRKFLVFGNDRRVPERWLATYGGLTKGIDFYFLSRSGNLQLLTSSA